MLFFELILHPNRIEARNLHLTSVFWQQLQLLIYREIIILNLSKGFAKTTNIIFKEF